MSRRTVVVTGTGAITSLGLGSDALFDRWAAGECGIEDGSGNCPDFDPGDFLSKKEVRRSDRFTQLAIVAADQALAEAAWAEELPYEDERIGCVIGSGIGGFRTLSDQDRVMRERGADKVSPLAIPMLMANAGCAALALRFRFRGPNYCTVSACASGAHAIGCGLRMIEAGEADAAVVGGAEGALTPFGRAAFDAMGAISPSGVSRPFDARRDGFVPGEGAGVLVLEEAEHARRRGAPVLGRLLGYAANVDAHHLTAPAPDGGGATKAIELALEDAAVAPDEVAYVNAHGTSTPLNDYAETVAIKKALGERAKQVPVSSLKSAIGHLLGAGGAVEAIATVLALARRIAPPTLGYEQPDEELDLDYVPGTAKHLHPPAGRLSESSDRLVGISNSFGFGGHNAVLCFAG